MSKKIYGVTVGTPMSPAAIEEKLKPVKTVNGVAPDENGNVEITIPDSGQNGNQSGKTPLDMFLDNVDVDYAYDETTGAYYTVIRVYKQKLDGAKQYPFVYAPNGAGAGDKSTYDMAVNDGWLLAINSGVFNTSTLKPDGIVIQNGTVVQNSPTATHSQCKPLTIDTNGNLSYAKYNADASQLVANGIVSAVCGFIPIVVDYEKVPQTEWNSVSHYTQNAQRQIIGQWGNGDYAIITCEGRNFHNSDGWTIAEAQDICVKHGLKFAYNLDGGGSTETMLGKKHINTIYESTTGRVVPTFIVFNGTTVPPVTNETEEPDVPVNPDEPELEKTLSHISATYSGGEVVVGTAVNDLIGIVVTAHYSDGSTETVTGYTLSGEIGEGSNTITVSYGSKTTTFTVTGVTDSSGEPETPYTFPEFLQVHTNNYVNTGISETNVFTSEAKFKNEYWDSKSGHLLSSANTWIPFLKSSAGSPTTVIKYKGMSNESLTYSGDATSAAIIRADITDTGMNISTNGTTIGACSIGTTASESNTYYLFAYGGNAGGTQYHFRGKFYYLKLWDESGELVHHFKPAERTADGVLGVYDEVTETFYESNGTAFS